MPDNFPPNIIPSEIHLWPTTFQWMTTKWTHLVSPQLPKPSWPPPLDHVVPRRLLYANGFRIFCKARPDSGFLEQINQPHIGPALHTPREVYRHSDAHASCEIPHYWRELPKKCCRAAKPRELPGKSPGPLLKTFPKGPHQAHSKTSRTSWKIPGASAEDLPSTEKPAPHPSMPPPACR